MKTEVIQLWFMRLILVFVFHLIDDIIFPEYISKIAPFQKWSWMRRECNRIIKIIESSPIYVEED